MIGKSRWLLCALMFTGITYAGAQAVPSHDHSQEHSASASQNDDQASALLKIVRESTERFKDVTVAQREGYALQFGCVSGSDFGAMGLHFVNGNIVSSGVLDVRRPQIVIYEPTPDGHLRLIGADYLVFADAWNATHSSPPQLM